MNTNDLLLMAKSQSASFDIQGKSIKYNQLANSLTNFGVGQLTISGDNANGKFILNGTTTETNTIYFQNTIGTIGHKYFVYWNKVGSASTFRLRLGYSVLFETGICEQTTNTTIAYDVFVGQTFTDDNQIINIIDLTDLFGAGNEPTTLTEFYATDLGKVVQHGTYLPYSSGGLLSATMTLSFSGRNLFDGKLEQGYYKGEVGQISTKHNADIYIRCNNFIRVKPNTSYIIKGSIEAEMIYCGLIDSEYRFIAWGIATNWNGNRSFTSTANTKYIFFEFRTGSGITPPPSNDIVVQLATETDTNYVPYKHLEFSRTKRVDLGTLNWVYNPNNYFRANFTNAISCLGSQKPNALCSKYATKSYDEGIYPQSADKNIFVNDNYVYIKDTEYGNDNVAFKNSLNGIYLEYEPQTQPKLYSIGEMKCLTGKQNSFEQRHTYNIGVSRTYGNGCYIKEGIGGISYLTLLNITLNSSHKYAMVCKQNTPYVSTAVYYLSNNAIVNLDNSTTKTFENNTMSISFIENGTQFQGNHFYRWAGEYDSSWKLEYYFLVDLTESGLANLTAQQFYDQYNQYFEHLASGGNVGKLADVWHNQNGKIDRVFGEVDLGSLIWDYNNEYQVFSSPVSGMKAYNYAENVNVICSKYPVQPKAGITSEVQEGHLMINHTNRTVRIKDTNYTDVASFKAAMSGVKLIYELATPTSETIASQMLPRIITKCEDVNGMELNIIKRN